jgi:ribosome-associated protein
VDVLEERKGEDIVLLDIQEVSVIADYFVICSGTSDRMLDALLDAVVDQVKETFHSRPRVEGQPVDGWILADYGDVILHVFSPAQRDYYQLEELWSEAKVLLHVH